MPPARKVLKEEIIEAGYQIAAFRGLEGVNAREIAKNLKCSIQPVFSNFKTMEELKIAVIDRIHKEYQSYILEGTKENNPYKGMGRAYIRFAKEKPRFFQILFMSSQNLTSTTYLPDDIITSTILEYGAKATQLEEEEMRKFHFEIWIFTHGIATLIATNTCKFSEEEINAMLKNMFSGLLNSRKETNK